MNATRKGFLVLLLALSVLALAQLACTDVDGSTITIDKVHADLAQDAADVADDVKELHAAVINGTVEQLSPSWASR